MAGNERLETLTSAGVSVWLDDLSRERLDSGNLAGLAQTRSVVGVTTNPTIFAKALSSGHVYDEQVRELAAAGGSTSDAVKAITTDDVRRACDVLRPQYEETHHVDGRVSIEVDPTLAADTDGTVAEALDLHDTVDRPNLLVKIPATSEGIPAITRTIARGIPVNVTLIFSVERYKEVMEAYLEGLRRAHADGRDLSPIHSVASFFVSRVDTEIDKRLEALGTDEALALRGRAAVANARLAYEAFEQVFTDSNEAWAELVEQGAHVQRPLWASTGVKNPDYPDTFYVTDLVAPDTVNTMPEPTLEAFADHGEVHGDVVSGRGAESQEVFARLADVGIDVDDVFALLEREGVEKFEASWSELMDSVSAQLDASR